MPEVTRIFDLMPHFKENFAEYEVFAKKEKDQWQKFFIEEYMEYANLVSCALLELGLRKGDTVATILNNCPEWNFLDMGMAQIGVIHVPIYPTISKSEYQYILEHAEARIAFISEETYYNKLHSIGSKVPHLQAIYSITDIGGIHHWESFLDLGRQNREKHEHMLENLKKTIKPTDLFSIIYTSGTTGISKGVMLSHENILSNVKDTADVHIFGKNMKAISFLPLCHVFERVGNYVYQYFGTSVYYAESVEKIPDNIKEIKPAGFLAVPRVLEKLYDRMVAVGRRLPLLQKMVYFWAIHVGFKYDINEKRGWFYDLKKEIADKLVYYRWREELGGNIKCIISGGANLQPGLERIFWAAGMPVQNGYGLTETAPTLAANKNTLPDIRFGTVGPPIKNVQIKIAEDGEILAKGKNIMIGYYKNQKLTHQVIDPDGWFHTGDIGEFVDNKYLKVNDRKKEIFKLSTGKYVAPQVIETRFKESLFINYILIVGESRNFVGAIILPNYPFLHEWCYIHKIRFKDNQDLIKNTEVLARFNKEVKFLNSELGKHEQVKKYALVTDTWSPKSGELTPTLKVKRELLTHRYRRLINRLYTEKE